MTRRPLLVPALLAALVGAGCDGSAGPAGSVRLVLGDARAALPCAEQVAGARLSVDGALRQRVAVDPADQDEVTFAPLAVEAGQTVSAALLDAADVPLYAAEAVVTEAALASGALRLAPLTFLGPIAQADVVVIDEDVPFVPTVAEGQASIDVLANDCTATGADGPFALDEPPTRGTAEVANGVVRYTPPAGGIGADAFRYRLSDSGSAAGVAVTINACVDFDALPAGTPLASENTALGDEIYAEDGLSISALPYPDAGPIDQIATRAPSDFGRGTVVVIEDAQLVLAFAGPTRSVRFVGVHDGPIALSFGGDALVFDGLASIPGDPRLPDGVTARIAAAPSTLGSAGTPAVTFRSEAPLEQLGIGGRFLYLDEICVGAEPPSAS